MDKEIKKVKRKTRAQETWHRLIKNKGAVIGMVFLVLLIVIALLAPVLFDYETDVIGQNISERFMKPCNKTQYYIFFQSHCSCSIQKICQA